MKWVKGKFSTKASTRLIHRTGYLLDVFAIARDGREWFIFHLPTGMMFLYSDWSTLRQAKLFAEALLKKGAWTDSQLHRAPELFNEACHKVGADLGVERRKMVGIC